MNWPKIEKKLAFKALSPFILCNNNEPFLDGSWHDEKWILYNNQWLAQWLDWEEAPKHFPKSQICNKNRSWSLFGGLLPIYPLQLSEFWQNQYIWEVCSANTIEMHQNCNGQNNGPNSPPQQWPATGHRTNISKVEWSFASSAIFAWPLAKRLPLLQLSAGKMLP